MVLLVVVLVMDLVVPLLLLVVHYSVVWLSLIHISEPTRPY